MLQRCTSDTGAARFCSATPAQIHALATSIVVDMQTLWKRRRLVAEQAKDVRQLADSKIPEEASGVSVRAIAIDFEHQRADGHLSFYVEYDGVDEALRPGIVLDFIPANIEAWSRFDRIPWGISERLAERDALRALGADGEIDEFAAAILRVAPEGQAAVLARLAHDDETLVSFMTEAGPLYATLFWRDGRIEVEIDISGVLVQGHNRLELSGRAFSQEDAAALVGSPLASIGGLPFDADVVIAKASPLMPSGLELCLRPPSERKLVNCTAGRTWKR